MNVEAHLAAGWILAHLPGSPPSRRYRALVTFAAIAPDLDSLAYLLGPRAYSTCHHAAGHNLFFSLLTSALCAHLFPSRPWRTLLLTQLAFYSHYFGDYFFTRFPLEFFWPLSHKGYIHSYRIGLDHPVNLVLSYLSFVLFILYGIFYKRTPLELLSPNLDARVVNLFRRRTLACHICSRRANETCHTCRLPTCPRHGRLTRQFLVQCPTCRSPAPPARHITVRPP